MTLIVETGSGVEDANSYVSLEDAQAYAKARGLGFTRLEDKATQYLVLAMDYLESLRANYIGMKVETTQPLQWPRKYAVIDGSLFSDSAIPSEIKHAQIRLAIAIQDGFDPLPTREAAAFVIKEKVGQLETTYSEAIQTSGVPIIRSVNALLAPLLTNGGGIVTARA